MKALKNLSLFTAGLFLCCVYLLIGFSWADEGPGNPYVKHLEIIQTDREDSTGGTEQFTIVKVIFNSLPDSAEDLIDYMEFRDSNGEVYQFYPEEFYSTKSFDYYLKELPFFLPDSEIEITVYDNEDVEYHFTPQQSQDRTAKSGTYDGSWSGKTNQSYDVSFIVSNDIVTQFKIKLRVYGAYCAVTITMLITGDRPISDDSFTYSGFTPGTYGYTYEYTGTFTDSTICSGTWYLYNNYCDGSGNGTWNATNNTVSPQLFVASDGSCNGNTPCYSTIQSAIDSAATGSTINVTSETYIEDVVLDASKDLTLQGGWNLTFTAQSSNTTIAGSMTISNGTVTVENIVLQ